VLEAVSAIAREAGRIAASRCDTAFDRWEKAPGNPVCAVDLEVDAFLREQLSADRVADRDLPAGIGTQLATQ